LASNEPSFNERLVSTVAHHGCIGAPSKDELERLDKKRLARARFARYHAQSIVKNDMDIRNDSEIADTKLGEHRS
jgi:hypothetical protein